MPAPRKTAAPKAAKPVSRKTAARKASAPAAGDTGTASDGTLVTGIGNARGLNPTFTPNGTPFHFALAEEVVITQSKEAGVVRARAEWVTGNIGYYVAYTSSRGEFREQWIDQDLLEGTL